MNKGYDSKEALYELGRLRAAGMDYGANIIFGGAGAGKIESHLASGTMFHTRSQHLHLSP